MRKIYLLAIGLAAALFLGSCSSLAPKESETPLRVKSGKMFTVVISSNPTTGYQWKLLGGLDPSHAVFDRQEYKPLGRAIGSGGRDVWYFKAAEPGTFTLHFAQFPPKTGAEPVMRLDFTVIVHR
jgi:predicted secreted protein